MDHIRQQLNQQLEELDRLLIEVNYSLQQLPDLPEKRLRISSFKGHPQYYLRSRKSDTNGTYLRAGSKEIAIGIAQRDFDLQMKHYIEEQLRSIRRFLKTYCPEKLLEIYNSLSEMRKNLVHPYLEPDHVFIDKWLSEKYPPLFIPEAEGKFFTNKGERVRSKSEKILADKFDALNIPYKYERPLRLKNGKVIYPDFTLLNIRLRIEFIWEHFGLIDNGEYCEKSMLKIKGLQDSDFIPGENLIMSFETKEEPLDTKKVDLMIQRYLL